MSTRITAHVHQALQQLEADRKRLDQQIAALQHVVALFNGEGTDGGAAIASRPIIRRRGMSVAARKAVSQRMKAYWAQRRAAKATKSTVRPKGR